MEEFEQLIELINKTEIAQNKKNELVKSFSGFEDVELETIIALISEDPSILFALADNLEKKKIAFAMKDQDLINSILNEEKLLLGIKD